MLLLAKSLILYIVFNLSFVIAKEIPVIVISAGKTVQSYSSVGSQVTVIDSEIIENSPETFLTDLLDGESQGLNISINTHYFDFYENVYMYKKKYKLMKL